MKIIKAENLVKKYGHRETGVLALDHVSLEIEKGERVVVTGTSGSGKSTLLHVLSGLEQPDSGSVQIMEKSMHQMSRSQRAVFRRENIGFVFQNFQLMPMLSVKENIELPCQLGKKEIPKEYLQSIIRHLALEDKLERYPWQLSGGQQQRVAIGRALIMRPAIVLADEPTGNLDRKNSNEVLSLLKEANEQFGQTLMIITHDEEVKQYATKNYIMEDGRINLE